MTESFNYRRSSMPAKLPDSEEEQQHVKVCGPTCDEGCAICPYRDLKDETIEEGHIDGV